LGKILAIAGAMNQKEVTWFPSYGAEIRGGTANCTVIISDDMIGSPVVVKPDILIIMNKSSLERFQVGLMKKGLLFFDSSLVTTPLIRKDIKALPVPATKIAGSLGNTKSANMVMLGAVIAHTGILSKSAIINIFETSSHMWKNAGSNININAFSEGTKYIEDTKS
jgi:2-oxoglutarate ferredoxin oxidoreductase subunit gamma